MTQETPTLNTEPTDTAALEESATPAPAASGAHLGQEPKASPTARWLVIILGLLLIAGAVVLGRDLWIRDHRREELALPQVLDTLSAATYEPWMLPAGIACVVVGVILLVLALRPRKSTHHRVSSEVSLWLRPVDIARKSTATASRVTGVSTAHSQATKKAVTVHVTGDAEDEHLGARVEQAVAAIARELDPVPEVKVRVRPRGEVQS